MTPQPTTWTTAGRRLWQRAGLWRASLLLALASTAAFVAFPPEARHTGPPADSATANASYTPPPRPNPPIQASVNPTVDPPTMPSTSPPATPQPAAATKPALAPLESAAPAPVTPARPPRPAPAAAPAITADKPVHATPMTAQIQASAGASPGTMMGRSFRDKFVINGHPLPLPPGSWTVLAEIRGNRPEAASYSWFLARIERQRLAGAIVVVSAVSNSTPPAGFPASQACNDGNSLYIANESNIANGSQACWLMHNTFTLPWTRWDDRGVRIGQVERAAAGELSLRNVAYPQDFVTVQFHRASKAEVLDVSYMFSPEQEQLTSAPATTFRESDWYGPNIARDPAKMAYVSRLKQWGTGWWDRFKLAFSIAQ